MSEMKIFVAGRGYGYARWFADKVTIVENIQDADLVLFTGGEDIWPGLYKHKDLPQTHYWPINPEFGMPDRDYMEVQVFKAALANNKPMFGVCRGLQFLTAMNGGTLIQHVNNHAGQSHDIWWNDGDVTSTTSLHHQMCNPFNLPKEDYVLLGWAARVLSKPGNYISGRHPEENHTAKDGYFRSPIHLADVGGKAVDIEIPEEPEVILYPKTRSMGVQGHPEMYASYDTPLHNKLRELVHKYLLTPVNKVDNKKAIVHG